MLTHCDLCTEELPSTQVNRVSGMNLCDLCYADPVAPLAAHGIRYQSRTWREEIPRRRGKRVIFHREIELDLGALDTGLELRCTRQYTPIQWLDVFSRLWRFVRKPAPAPVDLEIGMPIFDEAIVVETDSPTLASDLLSDEGIQSTILVLVGNVGEFSLAGAKVRLSSQLNRESNTEHHQRESAIVGLHLRRWVLKQRGLAQTET